MALMRRILQAVAAVAALAMAAAPAQARGLIRDAEVEGVLRDMSEPILRAAGMRPDSLRLFILNDPALNAFVFDGRSMVIHTGLLRRFDDPDTITGVIAHETGHLVGGHLARRAANVDRLSLASALTMAAAIAAAAASGETQAGAAVAMGGRETLRRAFLAYSRGEEAAADQSGVDFMTRAGVNPEGLLGVLRVFQGQEVFSASRIDPYAQTHPLSSERIQLLERRVRESPAYGAPPDPAMLRRYARAQAKLDGFLERPERVLERLKLEEDPGSAPNRYRRAIALFRMAQTDAALDVLDGLLREEPDDPYYWELRGQILLESNRAADAVAPYRRAVSLVPDAPLIAGGLGRALLAAGQDAEALRTLERASRDDPGDARILRDLAIAYARAGRDGEAALATAERLALQGDFEDAGLQARRAMAQLPAGSPAWLRAQDVETLAEFERKDD